MKKLLTILLITATFFATSQVTGTRFGTTKNTDNTGRVQTYALVTTADVASTVTIDTILLAPNAWETIVTPSVNIVDSVVFKFSSVATTQRVGDKVTIMVAKGTNNGAIKIGGSVFILSTATNNIAVAANKSFIIVFRWNGKKWIESSRVIQL